MCTLNAITVFVFVALIFALAVYAATRDFLSDKAIKAGACFGTVRRSDNSETRLSRVALTVVGAYVWAILAVTELEWMKIPLSVLVGACCLYLFGFSSWFRNVIFFRLARRMNED